MVIYFDSASLAPPAPEALEAIQRAALTSWGHPHALHAVGGRSQHALDVARQQVADYLDVPPHEVIFTASAREGLRLAHRLARARAPGVPIVSSRQEHPAAHDGAERENKGAEVQWLALPEGVPDEADLHLLKAAKLVALSACNHEMGTTSWGALRAVPSDAWRVVDAVQAAPWVPLAELNDARTLYVISGAKLGAPLGIAALRVPSAVYYAERDARSDGPLEASSIPWLLALALGAVCEGRRERREEFLGVATARAGELLAALRQAEPNLLRNGAPAALLGPLVNVTFPGRSAASLVAALSLEGVCIAHTASCQSREEKASPVVRAAYPDDPSRAAGATRWSVTEHTTEEDIARAEEAIERIFAVDRKIP